MKRKSAKAWLDEAYRVRAQDEDRDREALTWAEATLTLESGKT